MRRIVGCSDVSFERVDYGEQLFGRPGSIALANGDLAENARGSKGPNGQPCHLPGGTECLCHGGSVQHGVGRQQADQSRRSGATAGLARPLPLVLLQPVETCGQGQRLLSRHPHRRGEGAHPLFKSPVTKGCQSSDVRRGIGRQDDAHRRHIERCQTTPALVAVLAGLACTLSFM